MIVRVNPIIDYSVRTLCYMPYGGHSKGCPNYGKKDGCPPKAPTYDEIYDLTQPIYAIVNKFPFREHVDKMLEAHPGWSKRQAECCLYWQPRARKQLMGEINEFLKEHKNYNVETCPEAMGINVTTTMAEVGIYLEWPPVNVTYQVALAGVRR